MGSNPGYNRPFCGSLFSLVSSGISIYTCHHPNRQCSRINNRPRMYLPSCSWLIALLTMVNNISANQGLITGLWPGRQMWRLLVTQANPSRAFKFSLRVLWSDIVFACLGPLTCLVCHVNDQLFSSDLQTSCALACTQSHCCKYPTRKRRCEGLTDVCPCCTLFLKIFFSIFFHRQLEKQISQYVASGFVSGWSLCIFITYLSACCFIAPWHLTALRRFLCCIFKDFLKLSRRSR